MENWISVEDRLPEAGERVLMYYVGTIEKPPSIRTDIRIGGVLGFSLEGLYGPVTHWMPLPEPPEVRKHADRD